MTKLNKQIKRNMKLLKIWNRVILPLGGLYIVYLILKIKGLI